MLAVLPYPQIDPALFSVSIGGIEFALRWYALAYVGGLLLGWRLMVLLMRRETLWPGSRPPMTPAQPEELLTWMVVGVVLGGRLGFVLFYSPLHFVQNPLEILHLWQGGMSFHGGFLGVIVALVLFCRTRGLALLRVADAVALATPLGLLFGRLANFVNAELWGRPTDVPWAMVFPGAGDVPRHPSQLYEAALEGLLLLVVLWLLALCGGWLKRPGAVTGMFLAGYAAARIFVENFRQGDAQFVSALNPHGHLLRLGDGADALGLTMGQILSLPMLAVGLALIWRARQRGAEAGARGA
jgi:phosphatidylglycerol:prolipoprotein diacylglycerol transferase